ncbi:ABC transporter ATP-binding protein [Actinocorallia sp. API 0066]|uniref:ABC transporter ATP-binding protein n=1 Tax=Actinocorallia sp. API 0066 TaxID=2896846 RepID=UPI001E61F46A|nr:ABC transporter ATP-binding protein [Actinocorallia sp. API 0066]MCD0452318.1 ABC transporter ATP-binding protein [Actinocorallia sp. API 0066]
MVNPPAVRDGTALSVRDLTVSYRAVRALHGVSLQVPRGEIVAVLGANGAGKTTLMRAISGVLRFHGGSVGSGQISCGETTLTKAAPHRIVASGVVQAPEGRRIFGRMSVEENLRVGGFHAPAEVRKRVFDLFPILGERRAQRASLLSGGEQQMLAMGRALMAQPKVLLLDEPTLGLAPKMAEHIANTVTEINRQGTSVLLVEQNAALALRLSNYAYVLDVGEVALEGASAELAASDEVRRRYLGVSEDATPVLAARRGITKWKG